MRRPVFPRKLHSDRGQSLVEITLFIPIMLLMLIGFIEIGTFINAYITVTDTTRSAARYVSSQDPTETRCQQFGPITDPSAINFNGICADNMSDAYKAKAATVKGWGADQVKQACQTSETVNFFYVTGCSVVRNLGSDMGTVLSTTNDIDVVVTTVPITGGGVPLAAGTVTWSLYGNKTSGFLKTSPPASVNDFDDSFKTELSRYGTAPSTGVVIVEVYASHKQVTGLFSFVSRLAGGNVVLPDPIPIHVYSIFPLVALDPSHG